LAGNLRIYIAISNFLPLVGGAEKQALAQARSLRERGYETTIITLRHDKVWPRREMIDSVPVIRVAGILLADRERLPQLLKKLVYLMGLLVLGWTLWTIANAMMSYTSINSTCWRYQLPWHAD